MLEYNDAVPAFILVVILFIARSVLALNRLFVTSYLFGVVWAVFSTLLGSALLFIVDSMRMPLFTRLFDPEGMPTSWGLSLTPGVLYLFVLGAIGFWVGSKKEGGDGDGMFFWMFAILFGLLFVFSLVILISGGPVQEATVMAIGAALWILTVWVIVYGPRWIRLAITR